MTRATSNMPVVAEYVGTYLPRTETFIYGYLTAFSRVRPAVFASELINLDLFPFDDITLVPGASTVVRGLDRIVKTVTGRRVVQEKRLGQAVAARTPTVIHGHFGWSAWATLPLRRDLGIPLVTTFYGADMSSRPRDPNVAREYGQLFAEGDLFLVEGPHMRDCLVRLGAPAEKTRVQHIGVDVSAIEFLERRAPNHGPTRILMCSSFNEKKGITYGIEALAQCRDKDSVLTIAGDGPLRPLIEQTVVRCGLTDRVELVGFVDHAGFLALARDAHIFMAPSVTAADGDSEGGAPTVLLEAQASGLPVVSTWHADIPAVVKDGESGYLVPERDSASLAEKLDLLMDDPDSWRVLGAAGRRHVAEHYDLPKQAWELEEAYFSVMN
jgi:colanic acid/amylovoran biosynthesis glycosyltransferase